MTKENLPLWWENMTKGGLLQTGVGTKHYDELMGYVKMKTEISEFIWYALTGTLVTSVSYNYILNSGCTQSVAEMEKRHDEYVEQEKKMADEQQNKEDNKMVYKTYE